MSHVLRIAGQDIGHIGYDKRLALIERFSRHSGHLEKRRIHIQP